MHARMHAIHACMHACYDRAFIYTLTDRKTASPWKHTNGSDRPETSAPFKFVAESDTSCCGGRIRFCDIFLLVRTMCTLAAMVTPPQCTYTSLRHGTDATCSFHERRWGTKSFWMSETMLCDRLRECLRASLTEPCFRFPAGHQRGRTGLHPYTHICIYIYTQKHAYVTSHARVSYYMYKT